MLLRATVLSNILCKKEQELKGREKPRYGSIRLVIEGVKVNGIWFIPDEKDGINGEIEGFKGILEISYEVNVPNESEYFLVSELTAKDKVDLSIANPNGFFVRLKHQSAVRNKICSIFVKIMGNEENISWLEHVDDNDSVPNNAIKQSVAELIHNLTYNSFEHISTAVEV